MPAVSLYELGFAKASFAVSVKISDCRAGLLCRLARYGKISRLAREMLPDRIMCRRHHRACEKKDEGRESESHGPGYCHGFSGDPAPGQRISKEQRSRAATKPPLRFLVSWCLGGGYGILVLTTKAPRHQDILLNRN